MNKAVELLNLWASYEQENPKADLAQFCQTYLASQAPKGSLASFWQSPLPPDKASLLIKLIGRISKLHTLHALAAFKECGLNSFDEFLYLSSVAYMTNPKKTDVISAHFNELSSGLLILDRLKKSGLILEHGDAYDKRTKRLTITSKGQSNLEACYQRLNQVNQMCFGELAEEQVELGIHLLQPIEASLAGHWLAAKLK
ncbi:MarR family winged helix-turn-helix transcriptional regulator [Spirosoma validum]|uniref:Winged helix DNA-binding protein n=1 Tax=Spirosoma validum TaxID=2771355 RepID=A0A927B9I8_9BACT|nr:MarR family winged helix-turn-helix transcriptional regulator [Spirosoma validum]MBD2757713.1 winged helix DNA-binding protein [Spirosoma validum]